MDRALVPINKVVEINRSTSFLLVRRVVHTTENIFFAVLA